jgi:hypothetical protein
MSALARESGPAENAKLQTFEPFPISRTQSIAVLVLVKADLALRLAR